MNIIEKPPFNIEIDGRLYTSDENKLPSSILLNIVQNIYRKAEEVNTTVYLAHVQDNLYELSIDDADDELWDSYSIYLYEVEAQ